MKSDPHDGLEQACQALEADAESQRITVMKPRLGNTVLYRCPVPRPDYFEDSEQLPAIITRVRAIGIVDIAVITHVDAPRIVQAASVSWGDGPHQWTWPDIPQSENPLKIG
jgi:hypothetical protein